jgi:hypothetical protein
VGLGAKRVLVVIKTQSGINSAKNELYIAMLGTVITFAGINTFESHGEILPNDASGGQVEIFLIVYLSYIYTVNPEFTTNLL